MKHQRTILAACSLLGLLAFSRLSAQAIIPEPLPVPTLRDLIEPWIFVRASEASTLFIDDNLKNREPYGHLLVADNNQYHWLEFDGTRTELWKVSGIDRSEKQLTLHLTPINGHEDGRASRLVIYPYWDIDNCLVMIRFDPDAEENPVRFSTPYGLKSTLPHLTPEQ